MLKNTLITENSCTIYVFIIRRKFRFNKMFDTINLRTRDDDGKKRYCWSTVKFSDFFKTVIVKGKSGTYRQINFGQFTTNIISRLFLTTVKISLRILVTQFLNLIVQ